MHTKVHTHTHVRTHPRTQTETHARAHTRARAHIHTHTHGHTHTERERRSGGGGAVFCQRALPSSMSLSFLKEITLNTVRKLLCTWTRFTVFENDVTFVPRCSVLVTTQL